MNESILEILKKMDMETPATKIMIEKVEKEWNISLPCEYKQLILFSNGIEGPIGKANYLSIWPINELIELNQEYAVDEFLPGIKYFGSDGGDMAYGFEFDHDRTTIIEISFDSINKEEVKKYGESFFEFLIENNK
ncbi:MAG: SMI1/KNR4 family protein [Eubacterium sp.]|jgi:hypothetical protein|nr:SMI1/KNR4 family protein [Eubacterium sp.]